VKALTVSQPYASFIAGGEKRCENRTWFTWYRGPLLIHAGKGTQYLKPSEDHLFEDVGIPMYRSAIVALADLTDCVRPDRAREILPHRFHLDVGGPWCWILSNVRHFVVDGVMGERGLWTPSTGVIDRVNAALPTAVRRSNGEIGGAKCLA
jgi:hypothetical protein